MQMKKPLPTPFDWEIASCKGARLGLYQRSAVRDNCILPDLVDATRV